MKEQNNKRNKSAVRPEDLLVAIGDVHGCYRALQALLERLKVKYDLSRTKLIFLGDYTDRGECSRQTLELLITLKQEFPHFIFLLGNHEAMILNGEPWGMTFGEAAQFDYEGQVIPETHLTFMRNLHPYWESEKFVFSHGAPDSPVEHIRDIPIERLYWGYSCHPGYNGKTVVHGHAAVQRIEVLRKSICVDTGCTFRHLGNLSAVVLDDKNGKVIDRVSVRNPMFEQPILNPVRNANFEENGQRSLTDLLLES